MVCPYSKVYAAVWPKSAANMECILIYANVGLLTQEITGRRANEHRQKLFTSVQNLVQATAPDVLCMCEVGSYVGTSCGPPARADMETIIKTCRDAWTEVMDCELDWEYELPHPYLTMYNKLTTEIIKAEIVPTFVGTGGRQRFAQRLSCGTRGCEPFDIWNIHNPCPRKPYGLTNMQREESLAAILLTESLSNQQKRTTEAPVVLGGDMNITCEYMHFLMDKLLPQLGNLCATLMVYKPRNIAENYKLIPQNSPDFCLSSLQAKVLDFEIDLPKPKAHIPYGICIQCEPLKNAHVLANNRVRRWKKPRHSIVVGEL